MVSLKDRLTNLLISNKLLTQEQLTQALEVQREKGGRLSDIIIRLNFVKENQLISALSEGLGLPLIDLKRLKLDPEVSRIIPSDIARHYQLIPVSRIGDTVTMAMADPLNIFAIDHVGSLTGLRINPIISSSQDISQALDVVYPDATKGIIDDLMKEMSTTSIEVVKEDRDDKAQGLSPFSGNAAPVIQVTNLIFDEAVKRKASDILIEPFEKTLRVRFRIDGILQEISAPPQSMHSSIVTRIKVISDLDIAEHRLPQDGRFKLKVSGKEVDFRVSILPASFGEKVAVRILDKSQAMLDIDRLGFNPDDVEKLKKVAKLPHGMMLVCGPTGSGKTTTLYSLLKYVDSPEKNIVTVEDPVEFQLEGINQVTAKPEIGLTFAGALRSILRQDPNIIMVGEIRDFETVDISIKSALTGHLVLTTLHTTTAAGAVARLLNMGVEPFMVNAAIVCVAAQRLLRRVCPYCKEKYQARPEILSMLKLDEAACKKAEFYRGKGCQRCFNSGYQGRMGILEVLALSARIRDLILRHAQEHQIKAQARQEGMRTLRENGLALVYKGDTTIEEVLRVTAPD